MKILRILFKPFKFNSEGETRQITIYKLIDGEIENIIESEKVKIVQGNER